MGYSRKLPAFLFIGCICLFTACASTVGAGKERADKITAEIETAADLVERSNMADTDKRRVVKALRNAVPEIAQLGRDVDNNKQIADDNLAAAKKWRVIKWLSLGAIALGGIFFLRRFLPI